jgi:hypothetical protein
MALSPNPGYDKDGRFVGTEKGAYDHKGRKIGYDDDDMKVGISDTNTEYQDPRYKAREDEYMNMHPIGNTNVPSHSHPGGRDGLLNTHGGARTANHVRTDIRHGYNILKIKYPKGIEGGIPHSMAESAGYEARKHLYIAAEEEARKKAAPPDRSSERSEQFKFTDTAPTQTKNTWEDAGMDDQIKPAPKSKSKPKNEDTLGGAIRHVIGSLRKKS